MGFRTNLFKDNSSLEEYFYQILATSHSKFKTTWPYHYSIHNCMFSKQTPTMLTCFKMQRKNSTVIIICLK